MHVGCARTISPYTERSATTSRIWPHGAAFCRPRQLDAAALSMSATDVIEIGQQFYIRARSSLADARTLSLLHNDTLATFDRHVLRVYRKGLWTVSGPNFRPCCRSSLMSTRQPASAAAATINASQKERA